MDTYHVGSCNVSFFDEWTPDMAYVSGFLWADASVDMKLTRVFIKLIAKDAPVLSFIKEKLQSPHKICYHPGRLDKRNGKIGKPQCHLVLCGKALARRLADLGMKPRKTYNDDPFPSVPRSAMPHFIRGYFDGDGCASATAGVCSITFCGTVKVVEGIRDALVKFASLACKKVRIVQGKTAVYATVYWSAVTDVRRFRDYIYPEGFSFCLERKKKVLDDWLSVPRMAHPKKNLTREDEDIIRQLYHEIGPQALANRLGRGLNVIHRAVNRMGLPPIYRRKNNPESVPVGSKVRNENPWTEEEEDRVRNLYFKLGPKKLAGMMGRTHADVRKKASQLGVTGIDRKTLWSFQERHQKQS